MPLTTHGRAVVLMMIAMCAFAVSDTLMKVGLQSFPVPQALVIRGIPASLMLAAIAAYSGVFRIRLSRADHLRVLKRSLAEVGGTICFLVALAHVPLATMTAIIQSVPLAATFAGAIFLGEKVGWRRTLAVTLGFIGVLVVIRPGQEGFDPYMMLGLGTVIFVVARDLLTRRLSPEVPAAYAAFGAAFMVLCLGLVWSLFTPWAPLNSEAVLALMAGAFALTIAFTAVVAASKAAPVSSTAPLRYSQLLWALVLGWLVFGHFPDAVSLVGAGLIVASGLFTLLRERRLKR